MTNGDERRDKGLLAEGLRNLNEWRAKPEAERQTAVDRLHDEIEDVLPARSHAAVGAVSATDLVQWADRLEAQSELPRLVRRLILASGGIASLAMRAGEGVQVPGWDGVVEAAVSTAFVPAGHSGWEIGTNRAVRPKAENELAKRTAEPSPLEPSTSTFVFVTPRRFAHKERWAREKAAATPWQGVRVVDADDLEAWLELEPSVHAWFLERLGMQPHGHRALDTWWTTWARQTSPAIPADFVLAGRETHALEFVERIATAHEPFEVHATSRDEALAFIAAALQSGHEEVLVRAVVVENETQWRRLARESGGLILIAGFDDADVATAIANGHVAVLPMGAHVPPSNRAIVLPPIARVDGREALEAAGFGDSADHLAALGRRSLLSMRRSLGVTPSMSPPAWASPLVAPTVASVILAGQWDEANPADRAVVAGLMGSTYEDVRDALTPLALADDPLVRRVGTTWQLASRQDSWLLLARFLTDEDLQRYHAHAMEVLTERDPALDLPSSDRYMAAVLGKKRRWSFELQQGLADTAALLASKSGLLGQADGQSRADRLVHAVLHDGDQSADGDRWQSVATLLPTLAEASPDEFLAAVDEALRAEGAPLLEMFTDRDPGNDLTTSSPHPSLLWALEALCWSPQYLGRAALLLAELVQREPGGRLQNRPLDSLRVVFLPHQPHTQAPADRRWAVIDNIREKQPEAGWKLLLALLPARHGWWSPTHSPQWRDWRPSDVVRPSLAEVLEDVERTIDRVLADVSEDVGRWQSLIKHVDQLPGTERQRVVGALLEVAPELPNPEGLVATLRELVARHRRHGSADWALPREEVDVIASVSDHLSEDLGEPTALALFDYRPDVGVNTDDRAAYQAALEAARTAAVTEVLNHAPDQIEALATQSKVPRLVGWHASQNAGTASIFLPWVGERSPRGEAASGYVQGLFFHSGWPGVEAAVSEIAPDEPEKLRALSVGALTLNEDTLEVVLSLRESDRSAYWSQLRPWQVDASVAPVAAQEFLKHGRPWAAIDVLASAAGEPADTDVVLQALGAAVTAEPDEYVTPDASSYDVGVLLDRLLEAGADAADVGPLEWSFYPLMEHHRPARALYTLLVDSPEFFVDLVSMVYRGAGDEPREVSEAERQRAHVAYTVLHGWRDLPGSRSDGSIDERVLAGWFDAARGMLQARDRAEIGDVVLGEILAASPEGSDGAWPAEAVRNILESTRSRHLENGLETGKFNRRGVTTRSPYEGGAQERHLAKSYRTSADLVADRWPRTAAVLRRMAAVYEADARREDEEAQRTADRD